MHAQALLMATDWHHNVTLTNDASHYMYLHCADPIYVARIIRYRGLDTVSLLLTASRRDMALAADDATPTTFLPKGRGELRASIHPSLNMTSVPQ
jgi:hypothetical protein